MPANRVLHIQSHRVDPETHLHENHISNARIGRWRTELAPDQGKWLTELFASWLIQLGYETHESLNQILRAPSGQIANHTPAGVYAMDTANAM